MSTTPNPGAAPNSNIQKLTTFLKKWGVRIIIIGLAGALLMKLVGSFGGGDKWSFDNLNYEPPSKDVIIVNLKSQKICDLQPGKWKFNFPDQDSLYHPNRGALREQAGFYVREAADGYVTKMYTNSVRINGTRSGESVTIGTDGCATLSFFVPDGRFAGADVLGVPIYNQKKLKFVAPPSESVNQSFPLTIRFFAD